mgnify:CR=1 FL=1|tara:strand:- start:18795 stop:19328 length:534 start_codon:yes stop_codon:yes gene_type:complete
MSEKETIATKAKKALANTGKAITGNPMTTMYVGIGLLAFAALYFSYDAIKNVTSGIGDDPNAGGGNVDPNNANQVPLGATITNTQAQTGAATIRTAFRSIGQMNNDEFDILKNVLRGKNAVDYALYSKAFGEPSRSPTGNEAPWYIGEKMNLSQWISVEAKDWQKAQLRQMLPKVFK